MTASVSHGTIVATGAAINIDCGFVPDEVTIYNITNANLSLLHWIKGMAADSAFKTTGGTRTKITTLGVTVKGAGSADAFQGFVIGADTNVNVAADTLSWRATRSGYGAGK